jgi:two-component system NarL family sensor kinase
LAGSWNCFAYYLVIPAKAGTQAAPKLAASRVVGKPASLAFSDIAASDPTWDRLGPRLRGDDKVVLGPDQLTTRVPKTFAGQQCAFAGMTKWSAAPCPDLARRAASPAAALPTRRRYIPAPMKLRLKILLLALLPLAAALCLIAWAVVHQEHELLARERAAVQRAYMEARRDELRHYVELAVSNVRPLYERAAGQDDAQRQAAAAQALQLIAQLDYGTDGYFFVYDLQGRALMHSRQPELVGHDLWELRDPNGELTIQQLIAQAKAGGGFVEYLWRQPSSDRVAPKLGYVVALPQWNWMLGTGLYLDGIQATLAQLEGEARANVERTLWLIGGIALAALLLISASGLALNLSEQRAAEHKLRALAHQVVRLQEQERAHLARELHDGLSQRMVSIKLLVESAQHDARPELLQQAAQRLGDSLNEVRRISHRLRPALLDTLGLPAALQHLAQEFDESGAVQAGASVEGTPRALPEVVNTVLFRVAQEALTNVAKHAAARHVALTLEFPVEGGVAMRVLDDGRGFDPEAAQDQDTDGDAGIGLRNMYERLASIGGRLELQSRPGHGTQVEAVIDAAQLAQLARDNPAS